MNSFSLNGYLWHVKFVRPDSPELVDRTREQRVATTDPDTLTVYLSNQLRGEFLNTVFIHELAHCVMWSFDLLYEIHKMVKREYWIEAEEWICNFIADYGFQIFKIAHSVFGSNALEILPYELERMVKKSA